MARTLVAAALAVLLPVLAVRADDTAGLARNLAENILGKGLVRSSRLIEGGRTVDMVWESATYRSSNSTAFTRELLQVEAQFASEAIFRVLHDVRALQFQIVLGKRSLCSGRASRDRPIQITYTRDLGG
ncbi:MAG: hypothetical protein QN168_05900 [Armatimonadota bacterium]|nr:hypothetical protein [Armatimonadota bacterium]